MKNYYFGDKTLNSFSNNGTPMVHQNSQLFDARYYVGNFKSTVCFDTYTCKVNLDLSTIYVVEYL